MIALLVSATIALLISIVGTPWAIRVFRRHEVGQFIQEEVEGHHHKQGTPTMGGVVMVGAVVAAYLVAHVSLWTPGEGVQFSLEPLRTGGLLAMLALLGMALIGFMDDFIKTRRKRSLGLKIRSKFAGQLIVAISFALGADAAGVSTELSFVRPLGLDLGVFFVVLVLLMLTGAANGANLADGMDGLAAGSAALMFGAFTIIAFWQSRNVELYDALDPRELAILSAAMLGAILGFLWWNAPPARIFMGDVGSNAIGGLLAAIALLTSTQLLLVVLAGLYVAETISVIIQVFSFRSFGKRVFRMAPIHHHFELLGWPETTIVIRFWILAGIGVALALGFFYADFLRAGGLL
ncbi:MAG: phospho-N-acetylmuramoyl-pentapeptide-transferase [Acidimicrobiia bacterium]|nr:phospho-N-acetylmuramoyl-pentapeptide-transferase [Acidimicrobiia bacterium]